MSRPNHSCNQSRTQHTVSVASLLICLLAAGCSSKQTAFSSPEKAAEQLVVALRANDTPELRKIFGPETDEMLFSGAGVADHRRIEKFLTAYDEQHYYEMDVSGKVSIVVGNNDWPMPIPLKLSESGWVFDIESGKQEILNRRIGQNELDVIEVCRAIVDAQREYATRDPDGDGIPQYAEKLSSDPGTKNGLYWPTAPGEPESPLGPLVAGAVEEGYDMGPNPTAKPRPYHGYCYRLLRSQGESAKGGAMDYVINGKMIAGFAIVAWPAEHGNSGIMTFMVNHNGTVFQKDLGKGTEAIALQMQAFDPGPGWVAVPESEGE